jgi:hypothetical protein
MCCSDNRETGVKPVLPPQRLAGMDASLGHCEQSWEGDASSSVSPDTGLGAGTVRFHKSGNAAGGAWTAGNLLSALTRRHCFLPLYFLCSNIPTGTFGIFQETAHANQK